MISNVILRALRKIVSVLERENIEYCLFGGLAMQLYKRIRATRDIDLMISIEQIKIVDLVSRIEKEGFSFDKKRGVVKLSGFKLLRFIYTDAETTFEIFIDLVTTTTEFQKKILERKIKTDFLGIDVNIASLEDLILLKLLANRPIDTVDAQTLLEENIKDIDKNYLKNWSKRLNVQRKLRILIKKYA